MKLITLNIWGGHLRQPLICFLKNHQNIDIFCFQEVYHQADRKFSDDDRDVYLNIFSDLQAILPNHTPLFKPVIENVYGIGMLISQEVTILKEGEIPIHEAANYSGMGPAHSRNLQWVECTCQNKVYTIVNLHGLWNGRGKGDSPERLIQSKNICTFLDHVETPIILVGDFNLTPETKSMRMLEQKLQNLICTHQITSTRSSYYPKDVRFADYILTSPEIKVKKFQVLKDEVSDHLPLYLHI